MISDFNGKNERINPKGTKKEHQPLSSPQITAD